MSGIVWTVSPDDLAKSVQQFGLRMEKAIAAVGDLIAALLETEARTNAPWTDRTGQARRGLTGIAEASAGLLHVYLFHAADYGKWLEIAHGGPYRIIMPTIQANFSRIMALIRSVITGP